MKAAGAAASRAGLGVSPPPPPALRGSPPSPQEINYSLLSDGLEVGSKGEERGFLAAAEGGGDRSKVGPGRLGIKSKLLHLPSGSLAALPLPAAASAASSPPSAR